MAGKRGSSVRRGQTALEYVLALAGMLFVVAVIGWLVNVTVRYAVRNENLVSSEYP